MKISTLIKRLEKAKKEHGDLRVIIRCCYMDLALITVKYKKHKLIVAYEESYKI